MTAKLVASKGLEEPENDLQGIVDRAEFGLRKRADAPA